MLFVGIADTGFAQDLVDAGGSELYHPGLVHYRVGLYFQIRGDHQRAIEKFTQTIHDLPAFGYTYAARADSYVALGNYNQALADYERALAIYPDFVSVLYRRGQVYLMLGESELALADFANAIEQMPEYANVYWGLGDLYYKAGDYNRALENYRLYLMFESEPDAMFLRLNRQFIMEMESKKPTEILMGFLR